ncbi:MAG: HAD family hydrolase [Beijerinckiaceae bacterium]|nr:HAD family hydrolase [Beijerinckiaceae bacterium]
MTGHPIELVIFDCDGVLIDSEAIANQVCVEFVATLGHETTMQDFAAKYCGSPINDIWRRVGIDIGVPITEDFRKAVDAEVHRRFETGLTAVEGVVELLDALAYRRCVASSTGIKKLRVNLERVGLLGKFEPGVFSASQVARGKPAPDVFLYAASQMGADPAHCLVIEDSVAGVTAARRAGMTTIGFAGGGHVTDAHPRRLLDVGALTVAHSMAELAVVLDGLADQAHAA